MGATRLTEAIRRFESETGQKADITHSRLKRLVFDGKIAAEKRNGEWTIPDPVWPEFVAFMHAASA